MLTEQIAEVGLSAAWDGEWFLTEGLFPRGRLGMTLIPKQSVKFFANSVMSATVDAGSCAELTTLKAAFLFCA